MRINVEKYRAIAESKQITDEQVRKSTGLSEKTFEWIMENRFIEAGTLELIADVLGCDTQDIATEDRTGSSENVIEWVKITPTLNLTEEQRKKIGERLNKTR